MLFISLRNPEKQIYTRIVKPQEQLEELSRLFHAANRQFGGGLGGLGGLLGGELLVEL